MTIATAAPSNTPPIWTHCGTVLKRNRTTPSAGVGNGDATAMESARIESGTCAPCCAKMATARNNMVFIMAAGMGPTGSNVPQHGAKRMGS